MNTTIRDLKLFLHETVFLHNTVPIYHSTGLAQLSYIVYLKDNVLGGRKITLTFEQNISQSFKYGKVLNHPIVSLL